MSNLRHDYNRVYHSLMDESIVDVETVNSLLQEMRDKGFATLQKEGIPMERMSFTYSADLRYEGQLSETEVNLPLTDGRFTLDDLPQLHRVFDEKHDALHGFSLPEATLELVCLRVKAEGVTEKPRFRELPYMGEDASAAIKAQRSIYYEGEFLTVPIYDGNKMGHGHHVSGPAVIEEPTTTILIVPDYQVTCDRYGNYVIYPRRVTLEAVTSNLRK